LIAINEILSGKAPISIIGLGYVGLPLAVAFDKKTSVIGFDIDEDKIITYKDGIDPTGEVGTDALQKSTVMFTHNPVDIQRARFHIVAVPTPVRADNTPDLAPLESATQLVGQNLISCSVVVFESTVYPGVTEEICIPILEKESGLVCGKDFWVGYSPERINPGDKIHRLETIVKVVSGMDAETLDLIAQVYELVVDAGVYRASSIKVAEAAKVIENSQRDINIAFMNELAIIFNKMGIDTLDVLNAADSKWNFLNFKPGLVGGHCIGVDPYYLTYRAQQLGYHPQIILAGRRINDNMGKYVAENAIKQLIKTGKDVSKCKIAVLGFTFKENCPDVRNTRVIDIVNEFRDYAIKPLVCDPVADATDITHEYGIILTEMKKIQGMDAIIIAVAHDDFTNLKLEDIVRPGGLVLDVKGILCENHVTNSNYIYWRL